MEIQGPITVDELQEASVLGVPKLLRGSVRRRSQQTLNPSKWRMVLLVIIGLLYLVRILANPAVGGAGKWVLLLVLVAVIVYRVFFAGKMARQGYEKRITRIPRVLSVDPDGVRFEDKSKMFQFKPWSDYKTWREGSLIFLLRGPQRLSNIVPKRGLTSEQVDALRVQLAIHMPDSA